MLIYIWLNNERVLKYYKELVMLIEDCKIRIKQIKDDIKYIKECLWLRQFSYDKRWHKVKNGKCRFLARHNKCTKCVKKVKVYWKQNWKC